MKKRVVVAVCLVAFAMLLGVKGAEAILVTFTENDWIYNPVSYTPPPRHENSPLAPNEFPGTGILVSDVYQYSDQRDPFDYVGVAPETSGGTGVIEFIIPTNAVTFDWWFEVSRLSPDLTVTVEAYNASDVLLGSWSSAGTGFASGTDTIAWPMISEIHFFSSNGLEFPAISSLDFEPVPEPAMMLMLGGLGAGLVGARKLRRKK